MDMIQTPLPIMGSTTETKTRKQPESHDEMVAGYGIVTVIEAFQPGVDRLLLDFDAGTAPPAITFETSLEGGSTAVLGDGLLMVVLRGATGVTQEDLEIRELPARTNSRALPPVDVVDDFDPDEDAIEVLYDPRSGRMPVVAVQDFEDQTGALVLFDGEPILAVRGAQGLKAEDVILLPRMSHTN